MKKCYLVLADGHIFEGTRFGAEGSAMGELVFNTGVVGYEANLTDPNNYGQIVLQTFPMIGNYGVIPEDLEGKKAHLSGYGFLLFVRYSVKYIRVFFKQTASKYTH